MVQSKITALTGNGTWKSQYGLMYSWQVELEDGTAGECNTKTETPAYAVGDMVWYDVQRETAYGKKLKISTTAPEGHTPAAGAAPAQRAVNYEARDAKIDASWAIGQALQTMTVDWNQGHSMAELKVRAVHLLNLRDDVQAHRLKHKTAQAEVPAAPVPAPPRAAQFDPPTNPPGTEVGGATAGDNPIF